MSIPFPNPVSAPPAYRFATASVGSSSGAVATPILAATAGVGYILYSCVVSSATTGNGGYGGSAILNHTTGLVIGGLTVTAASYTAPPTFGVNLGGTYLPVGVGVDVQATYAGGGVGGTMSATAQIQYLTYSV